MNYSMSSIKLFLKIFSQNKLPKKNLLPFTTNDDPKDSSNLPFQTLISSNCDYFLGALRGFLL